MRYPGAVGIRLLDGVDAIAGREDVALPPRRLRHLAGGGDYRVLAEHLAGLASEIGGLSSTARVLDVGSGTGRVALGLTRYLAPGGSYDGLEIVRPAARWCQRAFSREHPNFRFQHVDLRNRMYNPKGKIDPDAFEFPFVDGSFDFAILTSVFTHLPRSTVDRYLSELARVLVTGGRAMVTFFLLNRDSHERMDQGQSAVRLTDPLDDTGALVADPELPELAIGHPEDAILSAVKGHGFDLVGPVHHGTWCGRASGATYQDLLVLERVQIPAPR
jgi:SAM-dependent methyltransferase